jgi:hypothetical protein
MMGDLGDYQSEMIVTGEREPFTHMVTLSIGVDGVAGWDTIYEMFSNTVRELGPQYPYISLSSTVTSDAEDITYDDETLEKVTKALGETGWNHIAIADAISRMQNAGILFRERKKSSDD